MILLDTNVIVAAYKDDQERHEQCRALLSEEQDFMTTPYVLAEVDYLIQKFADERAALHTLQDLSRLASIAGGNEQALRGIFRVMSRYPHIGLTDASLVALAAECGTTQIATMDHRHFSTVRPLDGGEYFTLLPTIE